LVIYQNKFQAYRHRPLDQFSLYIFKRRAFKPVANTKNIMKQNNFMRKRLLARTSF